MPEREILRGRVTAYPGEKDKGLVEVSVGAYGQENDTVYARVEQSVSGLYWLPEIGDVVEVALPALPGYEPGIVHVHRPEGDRQTAQCWTEKNDRKQFLTRSGHCVTLDDTQDQTAVTIHTAGGLELTLEDKPQTATLRGKGSDTPVLLLDMEKDEITLVAGKKLTIACGGASITFDNSGNIQIKAKGTVEVSGQDISVSARNKLEAKGQQAEIAGAMAAKVSGQSQLEISSGGVTQVKGGVIQLN